MFVARPYDGEYCICFPAQAILRQSINFFKYIPFYGFNPFIDNISYLLQSLDKQCLLCTFYISALTFSLLQIQHKSSFLLVSTPTQSIFPTCYNPKIGSLLYLCNFSSVSFYSSEDYFQVHDYQLLLFIYVMKIQFYVIAYNLFILVLYHSKNIFLLFSCYSSFWKSLTSK